MSKGFGKNEIVGIAGYSLLEGTIDNLVSSFTKGGMNIPTNMIELALGYYLKKRKGIIGSIGNAMFIINLYEVIKGFTGVGFNLLGVTTATTSNSNYI